MFKIKSSFGQEFTVASGTVLSYVRVERGSDGKRLETPFVAMLLDNGAGINANIQAIGRGLSAEVRWEHLRMLRGAVVTYAIGHREEGEKFTWRPSDTRQLDATASGDYTSILGIEVKPKYEDIIEGLPDYRAMPDEESTSDLGEDDNAIPTGTSAVSEPIVADKKAATKK